MSLKPKRKKTDLNMDDIRAYLDVYNVADGGGEYLSYKTLFSKAGNHTSVVGQLDRILEYLECNTGEGEGHKFAPLFRPGKSSETLKPTAAADMLADRFKVLLECYSDTKATVTKLIREPDAPPPVRVGATQTFALRLLPSIFSQVSEVFPNTILQPSVGKPLELLSRLRAGILDCVFLYVPENAKKPQPAPGLEDIHVCSFGYNSRMVLLCPPRKALWTKQGSEARRHYGEDANKGYWDKHYLTLNKKKKELEVEQQRLSYQSLRHLQPLLDIDFDRPDSLPLVITTSWSQPPELVDLATELRKRNKLFEVDSYEEALSWVRCGMAVAATSEVFCLRKLTTAFQLRSHDGEPYDRWIGACYNYQFGLSRESARLLAFVRSYIQAFKDELRTGKAPAFNDTEFQEFCMRFASDKRNWQEEFPMEEARNRMANTSTDHEE